MCVTPAASLRRPVYGKQVDMRDFCVEQDNTPGNLVHLGRLLGDAGVNMRAATIADTADFGILRIVVDNPHKALDALDKKGFTAKVTDVFAIELEDRPGGLA